MISIFLYISVSLPNFHHESTLLCIQTMFTKKGTCSQMHIHQKNAHICIRLGRFGYCQIVAYRKKDDMVMVTMPWGDPPAKAWLYAPEIVNKERGLQRGERLIMDQEDRAMHEFVERER